VKKGISLSCSIYVPNTELQTTTWIEVKEILNPTKKIPVGRSVLSPEKVPPHNIISFHISLKVCLIVIIKWDFGH